MTVIIETLKQHPQVIPALAEIWYEGIGKFWSPDMSMEQVIQRFSAQLQQDDETLPITFIAFADYQPVGMCSLRENDGIRPDLAPWLGSLVVKPDYQHRGIGQRLINATKQQAKNMGFQTLSLFALDPTISDYYARLGWHKVGMDNFRNHPVTVMSIELK